MTLARGAASNEVGAVAGAAYSRDAKEEEHFDIALFALAGGEGGERGYQGEEGEEVCEAHCGGGSLSCYWRDREVEG